MAIPTAEEKLGWLKPEPPTEDEVKAMASLKPGDYEVGFQRTNDIVDEGLEIFQRSSRSSMGIAGDVMVALFTAQGDMANAVSGTYLHAIIQPILIKFILANYSENPGIEDGDLFLANDAIYGGIHNPDQVVIMPIFHDGRLIAWAGAASHTTETGAVEPGGMPVSATSRFHEGMNLPPVKIGEKGELRNDWLEVFTAYGIRAPQMIVTDMRAKCTTADRVRTRVLELADQESDDFVVGLLRRMIDVAEEGARKRIRSWPDGTFRSVNFGGVLGWEEGLVRSSYLTLRKKGDRLTFDFTGTSPENATPANAHVTSVVGHVANFIYSYVFHDLPISSATFAPLDFVLPEGTCLNPDIRAATSLSVHITSGLMSGSANTFAKMMFCTEDRSRVVASSANSGSSIVISGQSQWGLPYADLLAYSLNTEGMGGRPTRHGIDAFGFPWCPFGRAPDVELMENEFPLLVPVSQHWKDGCGHGKARGGTGSVQIWVAHQSPEVWLTSFAVHGKIPNPQPLFGGYAAPTVPGLSIRHPDLLARMAAGDPDVDLDFRRIIEAGTTAGAGEGAGIGGDWEIERFNRSVRRYDEGDVISFGFSGGGAGYGDPLEAEPQAVADDVEAQIVSDWSARTIYRVAYDPVTYKVDRTETEQLRQAERDARLARGRTYEDFVEEWSTQRPPEAILGPYGSWPDARQLAPMVRP